MIELTEGQKAPDFNAKDRMEKSLISVIFQGKISSYISILKMIPLVAQQKLAASETIINPLRMKDLKFWV